MFGVMARSAPERHDNDADAARWWYQDSELTCLRRERRGRQVQKLQGCEIKNGLPVGPWFRETINQPPVLLDPLQALAGEDGQGAVAEQAFQPGAVPRCDRDVGVQRKAALMRPLACLCVCTQTGASRPRLPVKAALAA